MSNTETDIVQLSKDFLAAQVSDLSGGEDPQAFQMLRASDDTLGISLVHIPAGEGDKDLMADYLTAACCVHRAIEATFATPAWSSMYSKPATVTEKPPSERDNRVEIVMLIHVTSQRIEAHTSAILRVDGRVHLSPWIVEDQLCAAGRIPEALKLGIGLTDQMPQEMIEALTEARDAIPPGRLLELFVKQIREARDQARSAAERN